MESTGKKLQASALVVSILILGLVMAIAMSVILSSINEMKASSGASRTSLAYQAADEGIETVMNDIQKADKISDLSNCQASGLIKKDNYEVELFDAFEGARNSIDCNSNDPIEDVKAIKSIGSSGSVFQSSERAVDVPVKYAACNGSVTDSLVGLMLHMDGSDDGESFVDSSTKAHAVSDFGNVEITREQSKFCRSAKFDGASGYLSVADSDDWNFDSQNFTIDLWFYTDSAASSQYLISAGDFAQSANRSFSLHINPNSTPEIFFQALNVDTAKGRLIELSAGGASNIVKTNTWHHVAVVRDGDEAYMFLDGDKVATESSVDGSIINSTLPLLVGVVNVNSSTSSRLFSGYIDEVRISKGIARWDSDFTVPTSPY